jgi:hypothetical protein
MQHLHVPTSTCDQLQTVIAPLIGVSSAYFPAAYLYGNASPNNNITACPPSHLQGVGAGLQGVCGDVQGIHHMHPATGQRRPPQQVVRHHGEGVSAAHLCVGGRGKIGVGQQGGETGHQGRQARGTLVLTHLWALDAYWG